MALPSHLASLCRLLLVLLSPPQLRLVCTPPSLPDPIRQLLVCSQSCDPIALLLLLLLLLGLVLQLDAARIWLGF